MADEIAFQSASTIAAMIGHGYTYSGHPVRAAAALACLKETKRLNVIDNAAARGTHIFDGCKALMEKYDIIGDVRGGIGLMTALELVSDRASKKTIDATTTMRVQEGAYQAGAMIRVSGPNIILSPPLILTEEDASTILSALDSGFAAL
jgi:adenosylmethionine-8-amino-7-oxononanoate aminotransferase